MKIKKIQGKSKKCEWNTHNIVFFYLNIISSYFYFIVHIEPHIKY